MKNIGLSNIIILLTAWDFTRQSFRIQNEPLPIPIKPKHIERSPVGTNTTVYERFDSTPVPSIFPPTPPRPTTPSILVGEATAATGEAKETEDPGGAESERAAASCRRSSSDAMAGKRLNTKRKKKKILKEIYDFRPWLYGPRMRVDDFLDL
jgi:hypothetical protein